MSDVKNDLDIFNSLDDNNENNNEGNNLNNDNDLNNQNNFNNSQNFNNDNNNNNNDNDNDIDNISLSLIEDILKSKGIKDINNIKVEDSETGIIHNVPFEELTREEQLDLLNLNNDNYDLEDDEINLISFMRENELSFDDLINYYKQLGVNEYLENEGKKFKIDELSDEDVYALHIKNDYEDLTEDEIAEEVAKAKENETLFSKKVEKIREDFKKIEEEQLAKEKENSEPSKEDLESLINNIKTSASNIKTVGGFDLEESDINQAIDYLVKPQLNGNSKLISDLNNPDMLFKLAFYMTHGDDLIDSIHEQYNNILSDEKYLRDRLDKISKLKSKNNNSNNNSDLSIKKNKDSQNNLDDVKSLFYSLKD